MIKSIVFFCIFFAFINQSFSLSHQNDVYQKLRLKRSNFGNTGSQALASSSASSLGSGLGSSFSGSSASSKASSSANSAASSSQASADSTSKTYFDSIFDDSIFKTSPALAQIVKMGTMEAGVKQVMEQFETILQKMKEKTNGAIGQMMTDPTKVIKSMNPSQIMKSMASASSQASSKASSTTTSETDIYSLGL